MTSVRLESDSFCCKAPRATYRLQLNAGFNFESAKKIVPYLELLGISHIYISPILHARAGSDHCYDVVDHTKLNPELGSREMYKQLVGELRERQMGVILDLVANHMAIGRENKCWMDVLENGQSSQFARYFDIDWKPVKTELSGKILLPILGQPYGNVLKEGQLTLEFDESKGIISLRYFDHLLPLNPSTYPDVLEAGIERLRASLGDDSPFMLEFESVISSLRRLPVSNQTQAHRQRTREKSVALKRLTILCRECKQVAFFIRESLKHLQIHEEDADGLSRFHKLLEDQFYRLAYWRVAADEINYRRFFDINELAAVRMEDPIVFAETHRLVIDLIKERQIDGLRIDHPDGLLDPALYLWRLQSEAAEALKVSFTAPPYTDSIPADQLPLYLVVEKILAPYERVKPDWPVHGTVGYDFLNQVTGIFVQPDHEETFSRIYETFSGNRTSYEDQLYECKRLTLDTSLSSELNMLAHRLNRLSESSWYFRDLTLVAIRRSLQGVVASFPTYRTYVTPDKVAPQAVRYVGWAVNAAKKRSKAVDTSAYDFINSVVLKRPLEGTDQKFQESGSEFAMKFQQFTAPVMAKSLEDTLFYRYNRMVCLNEVGGDPYSFGHTVASFHHQNRSRLAKYPFSLISTSTHDTKRSEDVRARISVLTEIPEIWERSVLRWSRLNRGRKTEVNGALFPDANDEYMLYQMLIGTLPMKPLVDDDLPQYRQRMSDYMLKAVREAKTYTSWLNPNVLYEQSLTTFIQSILPASHPTSKRLFLNELLKLHSLTSRAGAIKSLSQVILKLTAPGVPDIYQGSELWTLTMVDPDNRQPVSHEIAMTYLAEMWDILELNWEAETNSQNISRRSEALARWLEDYYDGRVKLFTTASLLGLRKREPELFSHGSYIPLKTKGPLRDALVCYAREHNGKSLVVIAPRLVTSLLKETGLHLAPGIAAEMDWRDTTVILKGGLARERFQNLITLEAVTPFDGRLNAAELLTKFPVCVLVSR